MENLYIMLKNKEFAKTFLDSLPCGLLIIDEKGSVVAQNNVIEHIFGPSHQSSIEHKIGNALRCLYSYGNTDSCGSASVCEDCEIHKLASIVLTKNQSRKTRISLPLVIDKQVREIMLLLHAAPCKFNNLHFCLLTIEDIDLPRLKSFSSADSEYGFRGIVGEDKKMLALFDTIKQVARTDAPVHIQGESGTGKELVALAIHKESSRSIEHFLPVNCAALPETMLEAELFGYVKGAFTGAIRNKKGRFELANGGTIFLDEVGELNPAIQVKLLRVLQDGCFEPLGSEQTVRVNVRIISATNKELEEEVETGKFRADLYYRLCVIPITVPPIRERHEDIPLLAEHFLRLYSNKFLTQNIDFSPAVLTILMNHPWPGNVRELQNVIQFALINCKGQTIKPEHLPQSFQKNMLAPPYKKQRRSKLQTVRVEEALRKAKGNKTLAADILGVSRSSLYRFFDKQEKGISVH